MRPASAVALSIVVSCRFVIPFLREIVSLPRRRNGWSISNDAPTIFRRGAPKPPGYNRVAPPRAFDWAGSSRWNRPWCQPRAFCLPHCTTIHQLADANASGERFTA